ncbi:MAG: UvrD-helicase domain-containing protein [Elusimicrobia bacterium]|jgi:DNA helicase-2/ATP-dependent DNA helicase PcrA|nr:UvrD-helicase domain-containing protein [Elusimicrobiota bacterium]
MALDPQLLDTLNPPQREAVTHGEGPLLILAGAGSGKTRVITFRIAHLLSEGVPAWNILAVTFTNKAAAEMRHRVDELTGGAGRGVWISTFHAFCAQFLRVEAAAVGLDPHYVIYDSNDQAQVLKEVLRELKLDEKKYKPNQVLGVISRAKDDLLDAESYAIHAMAQNDPFRQVAATLYGHYQKKLIRANALDFGDLILRVSVALRDNIPLRQKYQARFRHVMVDEYQDTNHAQYLLAKHLVAPPKNLCVVGDDDQSIYSFRGADVRNILEYERDYSGAKVVKLEQNYRSTQPILTVAHNVISKNKFRKDKQLWTDKGEGEPVRFQEFADELQEAGFIARESARYLAEGRRRSDIAVFYRTNAQSRVLEDAFRRENIPYTLVGSLRFYERMEVKDVLAYLRVAVNPADSVAVKRIINVPTRGIGKTTLQALEADAAVRGVSFYDAVTVMAQNPEAPSGARGNLNKFLDIMKSLQAALPTGTAAFMVQTVLESAGYWAYWEEQAGSDPEAAHRLDNLQELVNAAKEFEEAMEDKTVASFLEKVSLASGLDALKEDGGSVTLMTVHLAKGLEFPIVYVTGLEEGLFPIGESSFDEKELEEERRLAYVAITRARELLTLTSASSRRIYGRSHWNVPSRFVTEAGLIEAPMPRASTSSSWGQESRGFSPSRGATAPAPLGSYDPDEDATVPTLAKGPNPLRSGQRVRHPLFGEGKILDKSGTGENVKVTVLFDSGARKQILARYANFEPA